MSAPNPLNELISRVHADLVRGWQDGCPQPLEVYLEQYPTLAADPDRVVSLICTEIVEREARGQTADLADYARRFPAVAEPLRKFLDVHRLLLPASAATLVPSGNQQPPDGAAGPALPGYEILGKLGRGGMGVVYKARHQRLNRVVALKMVLHAEHAHEQDLLRFLAEAEAVAHLQHPNVVQLFDAGTHEGLPYFTLEYVPGGSLAEKLREQPLTPAEAARLVRQVAQGVQHAHEKGVIHRDLKPANVLLASDGGEKGTRQSCSARFLRI